MCVWFQWGRDKLCIHINVCVCILLTYNLAFTVFSWKFACCSWSVLAQETSEHTICFNPM